MQIIIGILVGLVLGVFCWFLASYLVDQIWS